MSRVKGKTVLSLLDILDEGIAQKNCVVIVEQTGQK